NLFLTVCDAVQYIHQKGVLHLDLKPANILMDGEGQVKIIDLGVARAMSCEIAETTLNEVRPILGTLAYMSPEQCEAEPASINPCSDVYSLGVTLYELLCGRLPYEVSRTNIMQATRTIRESIPTRPSAVNPTLRGDLDAILLKCLQKDSPKRY